MNSSASWLDAALERRREQQRLRDAGHARDHALDRRQEAHVEHAVGFVEDQQFDGVELGGAALDVVEQAARARDEDVDAAAQLFDLRLHAGATEDGGDVQAQVAGRRRAGCRLTCTASSRVGTRMSGARRARTLGGGRLAFGQALQQRQAERGGLAGAGLRAAEHVVAGEDERNASAWIGVGVV
jgi:hypothetical protein